MDLNEYQNATFATAKYRSSIAVEYTSLGLASEAGEYAGKIKKAMLEHGFDYARELDHDALAAELGDVLWYLAQAAWVIGFTLEEIAERNIAKLEDRLARSVIHGEGDNR